MICYSTTSLMYDFHVALSEMLAAPIGSVLAQGMSAKKRHEVGTQSEIRAVGDASDMGTNQDLLVGKMTVTVILQSLFFCLT
jgi:hypothetical protein